MGIWAPVNMNSRCMGQSVPEQTYILFLILYIILWQLIEKAEAREKERMKKEEREVKFFEGLYY